MIKQPGGRFTLDEGLELYLKLQWGRFEWWRPVKDKYVEWIAPLTCALADKIAEDIDAVQDEKLLSAAGRVLVDANSWDWSTELELPLKQMKARLKAANELLSRLSESEKLDYMAILHHYMNEVAPDFFYGEQVSLEHRCVYFDKNQPESLELAARGLQSWLALALKVEPPNLDWSREPLSDLDKPGLLKELDEKTERWCLQLESERGDPEVWVREYQPKVATQTPPNVLFSNPEPWARYFQRKGYNLLLEAVYEARPVLRADGKALRYVIVPRHDPCEPMTGLGHILDNAKKCFNQVKLPACSLELIILNYLNILLCLSKNRTDMARSLARMQHGALGTCKRVRFMLLELRVIKDHLAYVAHCS
jgi:hypothetical protein